MGDLHIDGVVDEDEAEEEAGHEGHSLDDGAVGPGRTHVQDEEPEVVLGEVQNVATPFEGLSHISVFGFLLLIVMGNYVVVAIKFKYFIFIMP